MAESPTTQRSKWLEVGVPDELTAVMQGRNAQAVAMYRRMLHDGTISAVKWIDETGTSHLSVTFAKSSAKRPARYPTFVELADARFCLLPPEMLVMLYMPTTQEYEQDELTTLYLSEFQKPEPAL